jgi:pimeloyl-ACP methyl ester carboxylesterase
MIRIVAAVLIACSTFAPPRAAHGQPPAWGFVESNRTRLYYEVAGSGTPVVLIHGGWLNSEQWNEQFALLSAHHRVVRYDFRGAGRSPLGDSTYSHVDDLAALLAFLGIDRADLVGLSQGSQIAIDFTLAHPEMVRSLMIGASPLGGFDLGPEFTQGMRGVVSAGAADDPTLTHERIWAFAPFRVASGLPDVRRHLDDLIVHQNTWASNRPGAPSSRRAPAPPAGRLGEIAKPVLVIVGMGEMPALIKEAEFVSQHIPGAELVRVEGAGHFVNLEQPQKYDEILLRWLNRSATRVR